jgi:N6-adenosine-specific RNA methylase IME4
MSLAAIKSLPVGDWAAPDCALFLWATDPSLPQALEVIEAWGFAYRLHLGQDDEGRCGLSDRVRVLDQSKS